MSTAKLLHFEAMDIMVRLMQSEGELSDEDEKALEDWSNESGSKISALRALFHRSRIEIQACKEEIERFQKMRKRLESTMVWAKLAGLDLMLDRAELGQDTSIPGIAHIRTTQVLKAPDGFESWPVHLLRESDPRPDRKAALDALKKGADLGDGFSLEDSTSIVYK